MKKFAVLLLILASVAQAREYRAVFDCSSGDIRYVGSRMKVVEETIRLIEKRGDSARFAITLHGGCVPIVAGRMEDVVSEAELVFAKKAQETLRRLHEKEGVDVVACAMSLEANGIDEGEVLPFVRISPDSFIETIGYQNDGYALMTFP